MNLTHPTTPILHACHQDNPPSGNVILLSRLKCGLLLTISLATTVSFNTINVPTSLCNNGLHLSFACNSIIMYISYYLPNYHYRTKMYASLCPNCVTKPPWCNKKNYQMFLSIATPMTKLLSLFIKVHIFIFLCHVEQSSICPI